MVKDGYKHTEIGVIPENWEYAQFQDVLDGFTSGMTPYRGNPEYYKGNIRWITSGELNYNIIEDTHEKITLEAVKKTNLKILPKGTFLMAITGLEAEGTRGSCGLVGAEATTNQSCMALFSTEKMIVEYLYHFYVKYGNLLAFKYCQGTKQQSYTAKIVKILPIVYPPNIKEQKAIAEALSDTDRLITSFEALIEKKENIKTATMQQLLTGKKRLDGFSEEWKTYPLSSVAWFQEGPGVRKYQFTKNGIKLLNGTNIYKGDIKLESTDKYISYSEAYGVYKHFLADENDIVIACSGITIEKFEDKIAFVKKEHLPFCMNTSTMRFKIIKKLNRYFLYYFLMSSEFKKQIGGKATGSAQLNFGPSHVKKVYITLPPIEEQQAIAQILSDMDKEIEALKTKLKKIKAIKKGMMQELLTGKIRLAGINNEI